MSGDKSITLLVVASDNAHRASLVAMLRAEGYRILEATDSRTAYDMVVSSYEQTGQPCCSLVLVDTQQPSSDALILLQELRTIGVRKLPVLVVSGVVSYEDVEMVAHQRPAGILIKPFGKDVLLQKMGQLLSGALVTA